MDTLFLLVTLLVGLGTIFYWRYWFLEKVRALIRLLWISIFGPPVTKNSRNSSAYAAAGKIGLAIVIANQYEGDDKLNGPAKDKERWEKTFEYLNFDVRTSEKDGLNANRDEMLRLCRLPQEITIRQKDIRDYRYIAFVFSGHGYKDANHNDVIVSQDGEPLSLESEVFPCLFGGRRGDCIKLIFIDACRSDPSQEEIALTKLHVKKAIKRSNPTVHVTPDLSTTKDNVFIAFATLMGLPAGDTSQGSLFSSSFTKWLRKDISLVSAMAEVTEEVIDRSTLHDFEFRPMSVNMLSCKVNLYRSAGKGWVSSVMECFKTLISWIKPDADTQDPHPNQGPIPDVDPNQGPIPDPNANQDHIQDPNPNLQGQISDSDSRTDADTSSETGRSGDNGQGNSYSEPDLPLSTSDPPVVGSQQNRRTDYTTDDVQLVTRSEEETIPSTSQPPSSRHPPSSESQTADQTERVEDLDGPAARGQLSDTDHGMDSHILNKPIQVSQDPLHQNPEQSGQHHMVAPPLQLYHKHQDPPVQDNPANVQQEENVPVSPPVADEQPQQIQPSGQNNQYQVVPEGVAEQYRNMGGKPQVPSDDKNKEGITSVLSPSKAESAPAPEHHSIHQYVPQLTTISSQDTHSKPHKGPNKLTVKALMPYIGELASLGLQISGWLDMSNEWVTISKTPGTPVDHLQQLLMEWLNGEEDPDVPHTWEHIIYVVRKCRRVPLAETMEKEVLGRPQPTQSGPAEVHDSSTTVQGDNHPVLDSMPSESEINQKVGSRMSANWDPFAIQLSFDGNTRRKIRRNNQGNCDDCFSNVVCLWLERSAGSRDLPRTWRTVLEAVRKCGQWGVADDVRKELLADHTED